MKAKLVMIVLFVLVIAGLSGCLSAKAPAADMIEPRENSDAGIKISLTYLPEITDATAFEVKVTAHMDYNDEFEKTSYLRDQSGKTYQPLSYEGSRGHHATGTLRFPRIESKSFEVMIQDVGGVNERVFRW